MTIPRGDVARIATIYDINLRSVKKMSSADLVVAVSPDATGQIVVRKTDPNVTHPFSLKELLDRVNAKRKGRILTTYDHQAISWKEELRSKETYAWKHSKGVSYAWSPAAVTYLVSLTDEDYGRARAEYRAAQQAKK